jgi:hypothetical protein
MKMMIRKREEKVIHIEGKRRGKEKEEVAHSATKNNLLVSSIPLFINIYVPSIYPPGGAKLPSLAATFPRSHQRSKWNGCCQRRM